ncbi:cold-shock protein, partial [Vibrio parahaemolyticus]
VSYVVEQGKKGLQAGEVTVM